MPSASAGLEPKTGSVGHPLVLFEQTPSVLGQATFSMQTVILGSPRMPTERTGATGPIRSVYVSDPDANLIEVSVYEL